MSLSEPTATLKWPPQVHRSEEQLPVLHNCDSWRTGTTNRSHLGLSRCFKWRLVQGKFRQLLEHPVEGNGRPNKKILNCPFTSRRMKWGPLNSQIWKVRISGTRLNKIILSRFDELDFLSQFGQLTSAKKDLFCRHVRLESQTWGFYEDDNLWDTIEIIFYITRVPMTSGFWRPMGSTIRRPEEGEVGGRSVCAFGFLHEELSWGVYVPWMKVGLCPFRFRQLARLSHSLRLRTDDRHLPAPTFSPVVTSTYTLENHPL